MGRARVPAVDELKPSGDPLTFLQPDPPATSPSPSPSDLPAAPGTTESPYSLEQDDGWPSPDDESGEPASAPRSAARTSSAASSATRPAFDAELIQQLTRGAVLAGGEWLNENFARDPASQDVELWLTDEADAENIGDPLARIAARHNPMGEVLEDSDTADAISAIVGLAVYGFRQLGRWRDARRLRRAVRLAGVDAEEAPSEPAEPVEPPVPAPATVGPYSYGGTD